MPLSLCVCAGWQPQPVPGRAGAAGEQREAAARAPGTAGGDREPGGGGQGLEGKDGTHIPQEELALPTAGGI